MMGMPFWAMALGMLGGAIVAVVIILAFLEDGQ